MPMRRVLIVVHDMKIGGVQKSLLSFLQCLAESEYADRYKLDLLIQDPKGELLSEIPPFVNIILPSKPLRWLGASMSLKLLGRYFSWRGILGKLIWIAAKKCRLLPQNLNVSQKLWKIWKWLIPYQKGDYDVAVSYQDGCSNYYVMDKVTARKKVLWIHSEYQKQGYDREFDQPFFKRADGILTISEDCRKCLLKEFPGFSSRVHVVENITVPGTVLKKGEAVTLDGFRDDGQIRILSVGRLHQQKGFDIAIEAAALLRDAGKQFQWIVIGEGSEHTSLQAQIDALGLKDKFVLLGAKENPYPYMKACDLFVQPSRVEGKSIVLDEIKLFGKPIVATNYATVAASVTHGKDGWIVDMCPESLCKGIVYLMENPQIQKDFCAFQRDNASGNIAELEKYVHLMLSEE